MANDPLTSYLVNEKRHASLSPEALELMGKEAANMFLDSKVPLNEGIAKLAGQHTDINHEQVKRVAEFANNAVYLAFHEKNKVAGANSSYPSFLLADPSLIIQDLSDGARPTVVTRTDIDYGNQPVKKEKFSSAEEGAFAEMFKAASAPMPDFSFDTGVAGVMDAKSQLVGLKQHLETTAERFDLLRKEAAAEYYDMVKRHLLEGGGFEDVMVSARASGVPEEMVGEAMKPFVVDLIKEKVASPERLKTGIRNLEKVAHRVLNPDHPFVTVFGAMLALDDEIEKCATGLKQVDEQLEIVNDFIKEQLRRG
jgi:hypothetical protein